MAGRLVPVASTSLAFALFTLTRAHEHHTDDIPEGEAVSAEPLVSQRL